MPEKSNRTKTGRFKPGVSGNPSGRPKGTISVRQRLRKLATDHPDLIERAMLAQLQAAAEGDLKAAEFVAQNVDGKLTDYLVTADAPAVEFVDDRDDNASPVRDAAAVANAAVEVSELVSIGPSGSGSDRTPDRKDNGTAPSGNGTGGK